MTFTEYTLENTPINARPDFRNARRKCIWRASNQRKAGCDLRTFECPRCQHIETIVVQFR